MKNSTIKNICRIVTTIFLLFSNSIFLIAQTTSNKTKYTISGYVKDGKTGEELIGAIVIIKELAATGVSTNAYGFFSITLPAGNYTISSQFLGYEAKTSLLALSKNTKLDFMLSEKQLKTLKKDWSKRINSTSGIIYKYIQDDLIKSFIEDLRKFSR